MGVVGGSGTTDGGGKTNGTEEANTGDPDPQSGGNSQKESKPWGKMYIISRSDRNAKDITDGHAWIRLEGLDGTVTTMSLWGNQGEQEFFLNKEINDGYGNISKSATITNGDYDKILDYNLDDNNTNWTPFHTCAGYSVNLWNYVTGDHLSATDWLFTTTPRKLAESIYWSKP